MWTPGKVEIRRWALDLIVGRKLPARSEKYREEIEEMASLLRSRASRRGKDQFKKRAYTGRRELKEPGCSYCTPALKAYNYSGRGRISHQEFRNPDRLIEALGEISPEDYCHIDSE